MSEERVFSLRNPWFTWSVGGTIAIAIVGILIGFIWLPSASSAFGDRGLWATICGAAGAPSNWYSGASRSRPGAERGGGAAAVASDALPTRIRSAAARRSRRKTARCATACWARRRSRRRRWPGSMPTWSTRNCATIRAAVRQNAVMQAIIAARSDQDLQDLAAYYTSLARGPAAETLRAGEEPDANAVKLAMQGDPQRNIAPCAACHGELDRKGAAPWLGGQSSTYLAGQMRAFASGARHNDINEQMRNVARQLTPAEIDSLAKYYAAMQ